MKKLLFWVGLLFLFAACNSEQKKEVITVGASPAPHAQILEFVKPYLEEMGYELDIIEFSDYVTPNLALDAGDVLANYFQHVPYMENFNAERGTNLVAVFGVHFEPLGLYAGRTNSLEEMQDNAIITIPDDPTNEARALNLLESLGLITLTPDLGLNAGIRDVIENPRGIILTPLSASILAQALPDADFAVINGNVALNGGVSDKKLEGASEGVATEAATRFTNYVVARRGEENDPRITALVNALNREEVRRFIYEQFDGIVVPTF